MAQVKAGILTGIITVALSILAAALTSGMRLGAIETRTTRNEADIQELKTQIRNDLQALQMGMSKLRAEQCVYHTGKACEQ